MNVYGLMDYVQYIMIYGIRLSALDIACPLCVQALGYYQSTWMLYWIRLSALDIAPQLEIFVLLWVNIWQVKNDSKLKM